MTDQDKRYCELWDSFDEQRLYGGPPRNINVLVPAVLFALAVLLAGGLVWLL